MNLHQMFGEPYPDLELTGLAEHTSEVRRGFAFIAASTDRASASAHAREAILQGAKLVISEVELDCADDDVEFRVIPGVAEARGRMAAAAYADPSAQLACVGITGTNGKTSVAFYLAALSGALGIRCGYLGTLGWGEPGRLEGGEMTTGNAVALQRRLRALADSGCERAALEISSHALAQDRAKEVKFRLGVFTNLTRDHLDYHGTMEAYGAAKLKLFTDYDLDAAIVHAGDAFAPTIAKCTIAPVLTYGSQDTDAVWAWRRLASHSTGCRVGWATPEGAFEAELSVVADFAIDNLTAAIVAVAQFGHSLDDIARCLEALPGVPGRMEIVSFDRAHPLVVVDYAHTPDALDKALAALRPHCRGQLACVVGCGGDRDAGKRPQMARVASQGADRVMFTSDNPRSEPAQSIIDDMLKGIEGMDVDVQSHVDRREAIRAALTAAETIDTVLIAGKGHESYQEIEGVRVSFDDRDVARALLEERV